MGSQNLPTYDTLLWEQRGPALVVRLNRPEKRNALSVQLMRELTDLLDRVDGQPGVVGVILTGSDTVFSTGGDLNEALALQSLPEILAWFKHFRRMNAAVEGLAQPVLAAIAGYCYTGGLELALACDGRIAAPNARFAITSARIGTVAGAGGTQRLPRLVGPARAKALLFSAEPIGAEEAERIGLVDAIVPTDAVVAAAERQVAIWAERAPLSLRLNKLVVNTGLDLDLDSALTLEAQITALTYTTADRREGIQAFLEKRKAVFRGD